MIKRTLCFSSPAYLSLHNGQLRVLLPEVEKRNRGLSAEEQQSAERMVPLEDVGVVVLDNQQITITEGLMAQLIENNTAVIHCDGSHMPSGLLLPLESNTVQSERFACQLESSLPLRKQLWAQTVQCKICNQAAVLHHKSGDHCKNMLAWADAVKSGDSDNKEAQAAAYYWKGLFASEVPDFTRDQYGLPPNNLLNYGYAILRAVVARALVASGLLPTLGIHHHNRYNAYCLADDIMEPYRPYVDQCVIECMGTSPFDFDITKEQKSCLLTVPVLDVVIGGHRSPLAVAVAQTTASLYKCFSGELRKISYPEISM